MQQWIMHVMEQFGYLGVFLLILLENVFPPIPSEIILTFGGFMVEQSPKLSFIGMLTASTLGAVSGAIILYYLGHILGLHRIEKIIDKYGFILRLEINDIHKANKWFNKYGYTAVFLCRFVPLIRSLISIPAGLSQMALVPFIIYTTIGTIIWNAVLIYLGMALGQNWEKVLYYFDMYSNVFYMIIVILLIVGIIYLYKRKR
ncbi:DedA family protein [Macrococcus armenti]|uniref:DedA family protein n=1 Tax=Macrococcus armenti TaxID=2875764 RepID=UPI001CCC98DA|nr:DedA family protein [Macrococcus armenti]UBH08722.1 DedA family protein [Macrococcus armenti]UBH11020.1 DedA family protein [Macrococcus armenti]UBH15499.1 DedA family protein [Macrococcus armenti]UBH17859.1 DedA family protein [Macrococcus armenti]UBH20124.1 DedA family protein [Macrococcus armenti]